MGNSGMEFRSLGLTASAIALRWHTLACQDTRGLKWPKENFFYTLCWPGKVPTSPLQGAEVFLSQKFLILSLVFKSWLGKGESIHLSNLVCGSLPLLQEIITHVRTEAGLSRLSGSGKREHETEKMWGGDGEGLKGKERGGRFDQRFHYMNVWNSKTKKITH